MILRFNLWRLAQAEIGERAYPAVYCDKTINVLFKTCPIIIKNNLVWYDGVGLDRELAGDINGGVIADNGVGNIIVITDKDRHRAADRL